jgi:hypothetical protein
MTPSEEREQILAELEKLIARVREIQDPRPEAQRTIPLPWLGQYWEIIAAVVKDAAEWLSLAGSTTAFASKPWLQYVLARERGRGRAWAWPMAEVINDLGFITKVLLATVPADLKDASNSKRPSPTRTRGGPRNQNLEKIDKVLRVIADAKPRGQEDVFRHLERRVNIPDAEPFKSAGGWLAGFERDRRLAGPWLSRRWRRLGLPPFTRGPKSMQ